MKARRATETTKQLRDKKDSRTMFEAGRHAVHERLHDLAHGINNASGCNPKIKDFVYQNHEAIAKLLFPDNEYAIFCKNEDFMDRYEQRRLAAQKLGKSS